MENVLMTENEKLANALHNAKGKEGIIVDMAGTTNEELIRQKNVKEFNEVVDQYVEKFNERSTKLQEYTNKIAENVDKIEIMPIGNYVLVKQFDENPFQRIVRNDSGLITDLGGYKPTYKNTDNGEWEEEESFILVGVIQEVGPECKFLQPGDTIMYSKPSAVPIPFYRQGLVLVNETRALVTINEELTERFKNFKKN